jgi:hypothetical protein
LHLQRDMSRASKEFWHSGWALEGGGRRQGKRAKERRSRASCARRAPRCMGEWLLYVPTTGSPACAVKREWPSSYLTSNLVADRCDFRKLNANYYDKFNSTERIHAIRTQSETCFSHPVQSLRKPSSGCLNIVSFLRSSLCHRINLACSLFLNRRFKREIIGEYHMTLVGTLFLGRRSPLTLSHPISEGKLMHLICARGSSSHTW